MARARNPNRDKAYDIWLEHNGEITNRRIAEILGENEKVVAVWKSRDKWNVVQQSKPNGVQQKKKPKRGAPKGNKNAVGNRGGPGGPPKNDKAVKHGFFQKYFPEETAEIMQAIEQRAPIDILWDQIMIQYTAIIRAQQIMFVKDRDDKTTTQIEARQGSESWGEKWEVQQAWDKHATFLKAQSRAMGELRSLIKQYEELCRQGMADEEQQLRIEKLKLEVSELRGYTEEDAHAQGSGYEEALNAQAEDVFADEVKDHGEEA